MRRSVAILLLLFSASSTLAQKNYSLFVSANFDFLTKGLGTNDAGFGLTLHSNFFTKQRLQLKAEVSLDHFIGNKLLMVDSLGNHYYGNPTMLSIKAGPEIFIARKISVSALYGLVRYKFFADEIYSESIKIALVVQPPKHKNMRIGFYFTKLPDSKSAVHYFGINVGFRII